MTKLISIKDLTVHYNNTPALTDVNVDIFANDFIGIIGPNGGGKTTLVKSILNMVPYDGHIEFFEGVCPGNGTIGYLPQQSDIDKAFPISVLDTVLSGFQSQKNIFQRKVKPDCRSKAENLMSMAGIEHLSRKPIGEISGGQMQRTLLCRALISDPKLLILDEPANFIDSDFESELYEILRKLSDKMAIIMVSHDLGTITSYVKSIVCVNRTAHRHNTSEVTPELLAGYNCPIQLVSHGDIPHTVLKKH